MMHVNLDSEPNSNIWEAKYIRFRRFFIDGSKTIIVDDVLFFSSFGGMAMQCSGGNGALRSMAVPSCLDMQRREEVVADWSRESAMQIFS